MSDENDSIESCHQEIDELRQSLRNLLLIIDAIAIVSGCTKKHGQIHQARKLAYPEGEKHE